MLKTVSLTFCLVFSRDHCKIESQGQLNSKQFALAMRLMNKTVMGEDPPLTRSPYMLLSIMGTSSAGMAVAAGRGMVRN